MYISGLRIKNYKSFIDSGEICFEPGLNILIGPNSSGKTALLEAIGLHVQDKPHLSIKTKPTRESTPNEKSAVEVAVRVGPKEFEDLCRHIESPLIFPRFDNHDYALQRLGSYLTDGLTIRGQVGPHGFLNGTFDYGLEPRTDGFNGVVLEPDGRFAFMSQGGDSHGEFGLIALARFATKVYRFHAERPNVGRCPFARGNALKPDASNLAEVLNNLQTEMPFRFERLNNLVRRIFPHVARISVGTIENRESNALALEIRVWLNGEREDLAIPLNECGTGVGQALSMLSILVGSDIGRTIIIDEPQSFLHPGAAIALVKIMNEHDKHQYIFSTHSPEILSAANPSSINAIDYRDSESNVKGLNLGQSDELRSVFDRLGIDFSIFFSTKVLWVEGPTEEKAFPLIVEAFLGEDVAAGLTVRGLADTGSIQAKKNAKRMFEIYRTLSGAHALVPPIAAVILDDENRGDRVTSELQRLGGGLLHFIRRKCYENYLLDPEAIAAIANQQENFSETPVTSEQVANMINAVKAEGRFLPAQRDNSGSELNEDWVRTVDGARLLQYIFSELSERRVSYQKTLHSVEITKWMLAKNRDELKEIADLIQLVCR
jgi:predicted ATPase